MAISNEGSSRSVKGRTIRSASSRRRRSSNARSSVSGSWEQGPSALYLHQASFKNTTRTPSAATVRHHEKVRLRRTPVQARDARGILAPNRGSEQLRPFDAFVDVPSPFADSKQNTVAKKLSYPAPHHPIDTVFTDTSDPYPQFRHTPSLPSSYHSAANEIGLIPGTNTRSSRMSQAVEGHLDARTRAANLQHTRPEWTTWDFVDLYLSNLPPDARTVDLWENLKKEGEIDFIDIFVTRGGEKDTNARLRFRQVCLALRVATN